MPDSGPDLTRIELLTLLELPLDDGLGSEGTVKLVFVFVLDEICDCEEVKVNELCEQDVLKTELAFVKQEIRVAWRNHKELCC